MEALIVFIYVGVIIFNIMFIAKMWRMCNDVHTIMLKLTQQEKTPNTESKSQQKSGGAASLMIFFCMGILSVIVLIILFSLNPA